MPPPHSAVWFPRLLSCWLRRGSTRHSVHSVVRQPYLHQIWFIGSSEIMEPFNTVLNYTSWNTPVTSLISEKAWAPQFLAHKGALNLTFYLYGNFFCIIYFFKSLLFRRIFSVQFLKHTTHKNILFEGRTWYTETHITRSDKLTFKIVTLSICLELENLYNQNPKYKRDVYAEKHKSWKMREKPHHPHHPPKITQKPVFSFGRRHKSFFSISRWNHNCTFYNDYRKTFQGVIFAQLKGRSFCSELKHPCWVLMNDEKLEAS